MAKAKAKTNQTKPEIMIRVSFTNTGKITVEQTELPQTISGTQTASAQLSESSPWALFEAGADVGSFAALMYTFEDWQEVYPLQTMEALGGDKPYALDPATITHRGGGRRDVAPSQEVAFTAHLQGTDTVVISATKPGVTTQVNVDAQRPLFSISLLLQPDQKGYVRFDLWPGSKTRKEFTNRKK